MTEETKTEGVKRYALTARAQINGNLQEPGFVFTLKDGELGPHRTVVSSDHGANVAGQSGGLVDVPLYEKYQEPEEPKVEFAPSVADEDFTPMQVPPTVEPETAKS